MLTLSVILFSAIASYELPGPIGEGFVKLGGSPTGEIIGGIAYGRLPAVCSEINPQPAPPIISGSIRLLVRQSSRLTYVPLNWSMMNSCFADAPFRIVAGQGIYQLYLVPGTVRLGGHMRVMITFPNGSALFQSPRPSQSSYGNVSVPILPGFATKVGIYLDTGIT